MSEYSLQPRIHFLEVLAEPTSNIKPGPFYFPSLDCCILHQWKEASQTHTSIGCPLAQPLRVIMGDEASYCLLQLEGKSIVHRVSCPFYTECYKFCIENKFWSKKKILFLDILEITVFKGLLPNRSLPLATPYRSLYLCTCFVVLFCFLFCFV